MTNVQLKGSRPEAPWLVIDGTPTQIVDQITEVFPDLGPADVTELPSLVAKARALWAAQSEVGATLGGTEVPQPQVPVNNYPPNPTASAPAQQTYAPQASAVGGRSDTETDRWGKSYQHGHPQAPQTPFGPAVLKRAQSQAGKPYARWVDPRAKEIPSVYAAGTRNDPPDLWPGDFAKGV